MTTTQKQDFLVNTAFVLTVTALVGLFFRYAIWYVFPFCFGLCIAFLLGPITAWLTRVLGVRRQGAGFIVSALFYVIVFLLLWFLGVFLLGQVSVFIHFFQETIAPNIQPFFESFSQTFTSFLAELSPVAAQSFSYLATALSNGLQGLVAELSAGIVAFVTNTATQLPLWLITFFFSLVSSILISIHYTQVTQFLLGQVGPRLRQTLLECKKFLTGSLIKMLRAYCILFVVTFCELWVGLICLGVTGALGLAAVIALLDFLPLIGAGGVLVPWGLYCLIQGNYPLGGGILILWGIISIVRNLIEPRVVGKQLGLHPLVTITAMYAGLKLFGVIGLLLAPLGVLTIQYLNESGKIKLYKNISLK